MKVLLAADFYPPAPGGLEAHVRRLGHALVRAGHEVRVLAGGATTPPIGDGGVVVHRVPTSLARIPLVYRQAGRTFHPPWPDPGFRRAIRAVCGEFEPDLVHAHGWCQFSAAAECADRRPLVVTLHDHGLRCPKKNLLRGTRECAHGRGLRCLRCPGDEQGTLKRAVLGTALGRTTPALAAGVTRFVAVSTHVARRHLETLPGPVEVIPNFLDMPTDPFTGPTGNDVLYVGPADRHKGLAVLLRAGECLPPGLGRLVVVGATGSSPGVVFAGRLTGDALWQRYKAAALVVVPSIWPEPCPTVALEALGWGRPVVASRTGGLPDLVAHGRTGLLVPPGDPPALARAVAALLTDPPRLRAMAREAYRGARAFDTTTVVGRIQEVYDDARTEWKSR